MRKSIYCIVFGSCLILQHVPVMKELTELVESEKLVVTPPMFIPMQEKIVSGSFSSSSLAGLLAGNFDKDGIKAILKSDDSSKLDC